MAQGEESLLLLLPPPPPPLARPRCNRSREGAANHHHLRNLSSSSLGLAVRARIAQSPSPALQRTFSLASPPALRAPPPARVMKPLYGVALLLLCAVACAQESTCNCQKNKRVNSCRLSNGVCWCTSIGSDVSVNCETLTSKCLLMKAEMSPSKSGRRLKPKDAFEDTDGLYDPDCENNGVFKAKQCNGTTCWCVNTAGVRRTDKHDADLKCNQLVRTTWIIIEMKHAKRNSPLNTESLKKFFRDTIISRYMLDGRHISSVLYEEPYITIDLKQNSSDKAPGDVDIADVAYYFEKDVKGDSIFHNDSLNIIFDNEKLNFEKTVVYYVDEIAPEFSMKSLTPGLIAVIVVVVIAIIAAIVVLVLTRRRKGKYVKAEVKEMNEMRRGLNA